MPCPWHQMSTTESEFNKVPANISLKIRILNVMIITGLITSMNLVVLNSYFHFTLCVLIRAWLSERGIRTNNYPWVQFNTVQAFYIFRHVCKIMFKEWKKEGCQKKLWNGVHREEENEVDLNSPGQNGLKDWWEKRDWWKKTGKTEVTGGRR